MKYTEAKPVYLCKYLLIKKVEKRSSFLFLFQPIVVFSLLTTYFFLVLIDRILLKMLNLFYIWVKNLDYQQESIIL